MCPRRAAAEVCGGCRRAIEEWGKHVAAVNADRTLATVRLTGAYHWYSMFCFGGPRCHMEGFYEVRDALAQEFEELGERCCVDKLSWQDAPWADGDIEALYFKPEVRRPVKRGEHYGEPVGHPTSDAVPSYQDQYGKIDARVLELLRALWDHTARFAEMAYLGGVTDGRNLLAQMAAGQLSGEELQKEDVRLAKRVQNAGYLHRALKIRKKGSR